jgi:hypothetical protein
MGSLLPSALMAEERPRLVVYLHTTIRARALEGALQRELPAVDLIVVSRHRDFTRELARGADAALALEPVLNDQGWTSDLSGTRDGKDTEPYVLMSIGTSVNVAEAAELVIGAVDLLGRERTAAFVSKLIGSSAPLSIKYVIKIEDLLPLLQFGSVNAVVLSAHEANHIKRISKLDLRTTLLTTSVGLAAVVFNSPRGHLVIRPGVQSLTADTLSKLGVDAWR